MKSVLALMSTVVLCGAIGMFAAAAGGSRSSVARSRPSRCGVKAPTRIGPNAWAPAMKQLAPPGPTAIRLCRYSGLNASHPLRLVRSASVTRPRLMRLIVSELDRLPRFAPGAISCPMDDGSQIVARLSYPGRHSVSISVGLSGCTRVSNGDLVRTALGIAPSPRSGPALLRHLEHLTRYRRRHR